MLLQSLLTSFRKIPRTNCHRTCDINTLSEKKITYQVDEETCDGEDISHYTRQTPSIHLPVISSTFSQLNEIGDGKGTVIFHMFTKIGDKNCKVNVDRESCINALFYKLIENDGLKTLPIPTRLSYNGSNLQP